MTEDCPECPQCGWLILEDMWQAHSECHPKPKFKSKRVPDIAFSMAYIKPEGSGT